VAEARREVFSFIERSHRTLLEEYLRIKGSTTWHETAAGMQKNLDAYPKTYNRRGPDRGRKMKVRTPYEVFMAGRRKKSPGRKKPARSTTLGFASYPANPTLPTVGRIAVVLMMLFMSLPSLC